MTCVLAIAFIVMTGQTGQDSDNLKIFLSLRSTWMSLKDRDFGGEVLLENVSKNPILIKYQGDPREHLEFVILDAEKKRVSKSDYDIFSPFKVQQVLEIKPKTKVSLGSISLVVPFEGKKTFAGEFTVFALYKIEGRKQIKSNTLSFRLK